MSKVLTLKELKLAGACSTQLALFSEKFGTSVEVTEKLCLTVASEFRWKWASENLLSPIAHVEFDRVWHLAWAKYQRVSDSAWADYSRLCIPARAAYERVSIPASGKYDQVRVSARSEYERIRTSARTEYERVRVSARAEYDRVCAVMFARLFNQSNVKVKS